MRDTRSHSASRIAPKPGHSFQSGSGAAVIGTVDARRATTPSNLQFVVSGLLVFLSTVPVALGIFLVNEFFPDQPEKVVAILGGVFALLIILPPTAYLLVRHRLADPLACGLLVLTGVVIILVSIYIYWVSFYVRFPSDILIWSESDFVNDILKFRVGYPIFSAQQNNDSFPYMPGTQLLTFFLAWSLGRATSIPTYRMIQVGYTVLAAVIGVVCIRKLVALSVPSRAVRNWNLWGAFGLPSLFLFATNSLTNPFVHNLHNDALAQLFSIVAYLLLLEYATGKDKRVLALMAIVAALGFLVKQNLVIWAAFYSAYLFIFDQPRSIKRAAIFSLVVFGNIGIVVGACYLLWGNNFIYWAFTVLGSHAVSPLRGIQHIFMVWPYFVMGLVGGALLLRGKSFNVFLGPWLIWLAFILIEAWSSGIAWMLNHIGPGSLIAGIWFLAGMCRFWSGGLHITNGVFAPRAWLRAGVGVAILVLFFSGLGIIRLPLRPFNSAPYEYIAAIEKEFVGQSSKDILLDIGTWVYVQDGVIMQDRAPTIGERGYSETGDFSDTVRRLEQNRYSKILVHNLHQPDFWYDYSTWRKPSGIREAMLRNYHEIGRIPGVYEAGPGWLTTYSFSEISILVPNSR